MDVAASREGSLAEAPLEGGSEPDRLRGARRRGSDDSKRQAWRAFLRSYRAVIDTLEEELQASRGLPLTWFDVLAQLENAPNRRLRMKELARSVVLSRSGLTRVVDRMEAEGLVRRENCPTDRRGWFAAVTPRGRRVFRDAAAVHLEGIERHFSAHLTQQEAVTLAAALARVARAAGSPPV